MTTAMDVPALERMVRRSRHPIWQPRWAEARRQGVIAAYTALTEEQRGELILRAPDLFFAVGRLVRLEQTR